MSENKITNRIRLCVGMLLFCGMFLQWDALCADSLQLDIMSSAGFCPGTVYAAEYIEIATAEDLSAISENPAGNYILTRDIDMAGQSWVPVDFCGVFEGNGYAILNLTVTETGSATAITYDGNMKEYETVFAGFFGKLENAEVRNLSIINTEVTIDTTNNCFLGGIAGYADNSTIIGCKVTGRLSLTVNAPMFGVGGIVGFGCGSIEETTSDTTLVCIDTNVGERDEQFMGGAYAAGYINLDACDVTVQGYISDHGYVHSGGLVGMYGIYPKGNTYAGYITDSYVKGKITFFEDNTNRRAYCKPYIGEVLHWTYEWHGCRENFTVDERFDYSVNLLPEMCITPAYTATIVDSTAEEYGYTVHTCSGCGYSYTDEYVLKTGDLERLAAEEAARIEAEEKAAEAARIEAEKKAAEAARIEAEEKAAETARIEAEEKAGETDAMKKEEERQNMWTLVMVTLGAMAAFVMFVAVIAGGVMFLKSLGKRRK